jgi:serine/threonine protein kinase
LIDFGASKHIEQNSTLTTSLALAFTRGYCPPELTDFSFESQASFVQALKDIGPWTDIYSLGATMYNLLTDNIPPSSNRLYKVGPNAFMFPNDVSESTKNLIVWMMKPNKEERPQSLESVLLKLQSPSPQNYTAIKVKAFFALLFFSLLAFPFVTLLLYAIGGVESVPISIVVSLIPSSFITRWFYKEWKYAYLYYGITDP